MSNDTSTLSGALLEMKDQLIYELGQKGVTASYDSSTGLLGLIGRISDIQTGGSCYHIEFSEASYVAVGGSATLEIMLQENYAPKSGATVTVTGSDSSLYTGISNSNGVAEVTVTGVSAETTFTATYSNVSASCTVSSVTVSSVTLTGSSNILSQYHNDTLTLTATALDSGGNGVTGQTVTFYKGSTSLGTATTNSSGVATKTYSSVGSGDVSFTAECANVTSSAYSVEDCFLYSTSEISRTSTHNSDALISMFNDFSFTSNSYVVEADVKFAGASVGFGTAPTGRTTPYHHITFANSYQTGNKLSFYTGKQSSGENIYRYDYINLDTYYNLKYEFSNSTVTTYVDNTYKGNYSSLSYMNNETRALYWYEWDSNRTYTIKNVKIKAL